MREFETVITDELDGKSVKFILKNIFGFSSAMITRLKKGDGIMLNGKKEYVIKETAKGDVLRITLPDGRSEKIVPNAIPIEILYEDDDILAVNKPPNMPTHPSVRHFEGTLANAVMHYYREIPFTFRAVTRLDRDTSGVVVIARNAACADILSKQLRSGIFRKEYYAVCEGVPKPAKGMINAPIKREKEGIIKRCISPDGKPAVTDYETVCKTENLSLVHLIPETGRTHQLRLHLAHIGAPIRGDFLYGTEICGERTKLHCAVVEFIHPFTHKNIRIEAPLAEDMKIENIHNFITENG